jgi:small subunit ribosomal protein S13
MENSKEFKQIVRIGGADIIGTKPVFHALRRIKGVSYSFSNAICISLDLDKKKRIGDLSDENLKKVEDILNNPSKYNIPSWMLNRRKDYDDGVDKHLISTDIRFRKDSDIKRLKTIRAYRGMRHALGLPVRGQSTKAHFRTGGSVGVKKKPGTKKGKV